MKYFVIWMACNGLGGVDPCFIGSHQESKLFDSKQEMIQFLKSSPYGKTVYEAKELKINIKTRKTIEHVEKEEVESIDVEKN